MDISEQKSDKRKKVKMNVKQFWNKAVHYNEYLKEAEQRLENPRNEQDAEFAEYYKLGIQRMNRMYEKFVPKEEQTEELAKKNFKGKILIISEPWCGDASQLIPVAVKFFSQNEVRISYRDQEPSLIDHFLTNGGKSIPVVLFLDEDCNVLHHWGPRPKYGTELFEKHKANPETYTKDDFHNDLQIYYARNRGKDTVEELLALI